ncbi:hypothetical protein GLOTRDRAFT_79978 [Gloeophyllum trabeum ATCC 11539]|uniref:Solute carrier family 40 member n=1 Tax=Gloeophyllum trabeum (strain ATCC 11539 / FP-39264 / Madison 617) TaxID=670483 RepID=S7PZR7_GLOTA|nr:uncharacterized protein GLOTRDRAFT_79978 [Gloeophyllum trabeum ATCC 11539]EPQ52787.1 hypothetical protein GLOTRDRAFT_79978 [Gloeophyllum trabeum ATCC 11539]
MAPAQSDMGLNELRPVESSQPEGLTVGPSDRLSRSTHEEGASQAGQAYRINNLGLWSLGAQHLSSTWGDRAAEFAFYLYLIEIFKTTLVPASLFGFFTTGICILTSGWIGSLVDRLPKLVFVRWTIALQKISATAAYACFLTLFLTDLGDSAVQGIHVPTLTWVLFAIITLLGCVLKVSTVGISVAIERDWATCIAEGHDSRLTTVNTVLRRIDLICKLVAPLFVSLLTAAASYAFSAAFLLGFGLVTTVFELIWIQIVYRWFPVLEREQQRKDAGRRDAEQTSSGSSRRSGSSQGPYRKPLTWSRATRWFIAQASDWNEFTRHPVFGSSLSISLLYLTVLSFDGTLLSWLKTHDFSDPFVAGMRSICVLAGLFGTFLAPFLEKKVGLVRAGNWALWSQVVALVPVLLSFYVGAPRDGTRSSNWNAAMLFGGLALSRIGLWAFDLCQLKELQVSLADHPRRNALTGLQYALQNIADLMKYVLTLILSRPSQFRWAALVSFISVLAGAMSYMAFVRRMRGHIIHKEWLEALLGKAKAG